MKKIFNIFLFTGAIVFGLYACKKDVQMTTLKTGVAPVLTSTPTTLVLSAATATDTVITFAWQPSDYGFDAAVRYTLQLAKGGTNFATPKEVSMGNGLTMKYTGIDLNQLALIQGLAPGSAGQLEVRVKSSISDSIAAIYSNKITVNVTPYLVIINYPSLWVPGDYQGWNPATAPKISSRNANGIYEGYVQFNGGTLKFKYTSDPDWNHTNYGWASSTTTGNNVIGTMNTTGGDLFVPATGYYLLRANTNSNTWSGTRTVWGIIGDGVPVTGWNSDQDLTFDAASQTWKITLNLNTGGIKFRANDDWPINFGDTGADLSLEYDGANIAVPVAGNYTVTLDLHVPGNYTYTLKKN